MRHPRETLANYLRGRSMYPEVREFKDQCKWICSVCSLHGLEAFIYAREQMGLLHTPELMRSAEIIYGTIARWRLLIAKEQHESESARRMPWEAKQKMLVERERQRRQNSPSASYVVTRRKPTLKERMAAGAELHGFTD